MIVAEEASAVGWGKLLSRHFGLAGMGLACATEGDVQYATAAADMGSPRSP